jgi:hypothetical protein
VYQPCFPDSSGSNERDVTFIAKTFDHFLCFSLAVAEIRCTFIAIYDEWIIQLLHVLRFMFYVAQITQKKLKLPNILGFICMFLVKWLMPHGHIVHQSQEKRF